jgi:hypothetical protein
MTRPDVAAASTFVVTLVLSFKTTLHRFVRETLTEEEMRDGLLVLIFAFVVLPLAPDVDIGPYQAINPQRIARVVLVVLSIGAGGYVAQRVLGRRYGLLVSGFAAGLHLEQRDDRVDGSSREGGSFVPRFGRRPQGSPRAWRRSCSTPCSSRPWT